MFDTDFDHPMESVLMGHPERVVPFCVKHYRVRDETGKVIAEDGDNHSTQIDITPPEPVLTNALEVELLATQGSAPAALFALRCYA